MILSIRTTLDKQSNLVATRCASTILVRVRKMEISECQSSVEISEAWQVMSQLRSSIDQQTFELRVADARKNGYRLFVAKQEGRIVGAIGWRILSDLAWGRSLYVDDLVVDENYRSSGIGKGMLSFAKDEAINDKCNNLRLCSGFAREQAHRFYERESVNKQGFVFNIAL